METYTYNKNGEWRINVNIVGYVLCRQLSLILRVCFVVAVFALAANIQMRHRGDQHNQNVN